MRAERASKPPLSATVALVVALGGAVGGSARYLIDHAVTPRSAFPWTTFAINVTGALLLALLPAFPGVRRHRLMPPLLGTGLLGGFTTLSAYSEQTRHLLASDRAPIALAYLLGTLAAGLVAVAVADRFSAPADRVELHDEEGDL